MTELKYSASTAFFVKFQIYNISQHVVCNLMLHFFNKIVIKVTNLCKQWITIYTISTTNVSHLELYTYKQ